MRHAAVLPSDFGSSRKSQPARKHADTHAEEQAWPIRTTNTEYPGHQEPVSISAGQKRTNTGHTVDLTDQENPPTQRLKRRITRTRRALETIEHNTQLAQGGSQQMNIDLNTEE